MRLVIGETNTSMQFLSSVVGIMSIIMSITSRQVESDEAMMTLQKVKVYPEVVKKDL